jgi:hypothetical protein
MEPPAGFTARAGCASAALAMVSVTKPSSVMAVSTAWARRAAPSGLRLGARRDGDFTNPASIAASAILTSRAGLPKYFCAAASTP